MFQWISKNAREEMINEFNTRPSEIYSWPQLGEFASVVLATFSYSGMFCVL